MADGWSTMRIRDARKAAVAERAKAEGVSASEWVDRALAAALSEAKGPSRTEQAAPGPVGSPEPARAAAPRRASVKTRAEYAREHQARLNEARSAGPGRRVKGTQRSKDGG